MSATPLEALQILRDAGVLKTSGTADPAWTAKEAARQALAAAEREPYHCRCCGEETLDRQDCCSDDFPEPGDIRETGR